ncbi:MAG: BLUF domain-containing protein [Burkholderiaceae bacterium]
MLIRLLYISRSVGPQTSTVTGSILKTALTNNRINQITGVLCQGVGFFIQVLEGERNNVNELFLKIANDRRHKNVELISFEEVIHRKYAKWLMAHIDLSEMDPMVALKHPEFDPYSASGKFLNQQLEDWILSGSPINPA